jgi:hypothetical protein
MDLQKKFRFGGLIFMAALVLSAVPLSAQQVYKASFELPFTAYWNSTILEPGEYTVTVEQGLAMRLIRVQGPRVTAVTVAASYNEEPFAEQGRLTFANVDGVYLLERFNAGTLGQSFAFTRPKSLRGRSGHTSDVTRNTVVVATH